ncbi:hypothetical protein [Clostridium sp. DJ247]|uniref:hypothetical protein n=1 Tax=Clostridium sp. DJ247 TaxID=2726188 RepID=UPI001626570C|nr:hypothetical protein [Clostridium sp. DJ247]MBC2581668.1 hypothetical protein [Clostridium sp. DJ247]
MLTNDAKKELNRYVDDFIENALLNNYAVIEDSIVNDIRKKVTSNLKEISDDEISDYVYDLIKSDPRIHFYGVGEVYNYNGQFEAITDNPIITSKVFDNPFDAKYEHK